MDAEDGASTVTTWDPPPVAASCPANVAEHPPGAAVDEVAGREGGGPMVAGWGWAIVVAGWAAVALGDEGAVVAAEAVVLLVAGGTTVLVTAPASTDPTAPVATGLTRPHPQPTPTTTATKTKIVPARALHLRPRLLDIAHPAGRVNDDGTPLDLIVRGCGRHTDPAVAGAWRSWPPSPSPR